MVHIGDCVYPYRKMSRQWFTLAWRVQALVVVGIRTILDIHVKILVSPQCSAQ